MSDTVFSFTFVCSYFRHQAFSLPLDEFRHANLKPWHVMLAEKHLRLGDGELAASDRHAVPDAADSWLRYGFHDGT